MHNCNKENVAVGWPNAEMTSGPPQTGNDIYDDVMSEVNNFDTP